MSEWKEYRLGDIYDVHNGLSKGGKFFGSGYPFLTFSEVFNNYFIPSKLSSLVQSTDRERLVCNILAGDIFVTRTSETANELGMSCVALKDYPNATYNGFTKRLRKKENCKVDVDSRFIGYFLRSRKFRSLFYGISGGMSTRASLANNDLLNMVITLPSFPEQEKIGEILKKIDDKIAVNRRICENLEAQAQALFKHWFIDFAPFKNGQFVESELGMIPEGWRVGTLGEIADINPSRTIKKGTISTYLDMKNMPTSGSFPINWEDKEFVGGMKFKNGDTLMARITPCLENGKVAYVNFLKDGEIGFGSTEYIVMTAKESIFPEFLYTLCRFPSFVNYAVKNMNGSSGRQRVSGETISNFIMVIAPQSVYSSVRPLFQEYMLRIRECGFENLRLSTLRDTLLPKLMSGQIKV